MKSYRQGRRLAAVMFTDIVGYTAMSNTNEQRTLKVLEGHFRHMRQIIAEYHGEEIKTMGDGFFIKFESALAAVSCGVSVQQQQRRRNENSAVEERFELRVGIHLGDVEHRGTDIFGERVNEASRVQRLAPAGGLAVTMHVYSQIPGELRTPFRPLGPQTLKNIPTPTEIYVVDPQSLERIAIGPVEPSSAFPSETIFHPVDSPTLFGIGTELMATARSRVALVAKTPILLTGPRPYAEAKQNTWEVAQYEQMDQFARPDTMWTMLDLRCIASLPALKKELAEYRKLAGPLSRNLCKLGDALQRKDSRIEIRWSYDAHPMTYLVADDTFLLWFKDGHDQFCLRHTNSRVANALWTQAFANSQELTLEAIQRDLGLATN